MGIYILWLPLLLHQQLVGVGKLLNGDHVIFVVTQGRVEVLKDINDQGHEVTDALLAIGSSRPTSAVLRIYISGGAALCCGHWYIVWWISPGPMLVHSMVDITS